MSSKRIFGLSALFIVTIVALATIQPASASKMNGGETTYGAGRNDPYGCRTKVRNEMGAAPGMGPNYPGFWGRVRKCVSLAGGGGGAQTAPTTRTTAERSPEKPETAKPKTAKSEKQDPPRQRETATEPERKSEPKADSSAKTAAPVQLATPVKPANVGDFGRRVALVIGNGKYEHVPTLPNAQHDAEALAKSLESIRFQSVTLKTNLKRDEIVSALAEFAKTADAADWAAVYYSGHGIEFRGQNYMIPIDAQLKVDRDVDLEAVDVTKVISAIEGSRKLKLVILDACRDNPFLNQMKRTVATRSLTRGLARMEPEAGMLIVYSAKHGETALDGDGNNSPFATALMNRIKTPNLEIRRLFDLVRDDVISATDRRQQPFSYGSISGSEDFYFQTK